MRRVGMMWAAIALLVCASPRFSASQSADQRGDLGVSMAVIGAPASAESVFVNPLKEPDLAVAAGLLAPVLHLDGG